MAYIGQGIKQGTFKVLDTSGNTYNGSNTTFNLGTQVGSAAQLLVSHDGVIQLPGTDYTLASGGTQITFSTAPASGASIFIVEISGAVGGTVTPSDTSVTADKLNSALLTGQTDIGAAIADADLFLVDDGAGGTLRKTAASRLKTYVGTPAVTALNNATTSELVTVGSTTTELDAEADLTYDGTTFLLTQASPKFKILPTTNGNDGVIELCGRSSDGSPTENRTQIKGEAEGSTANTKMTFHVENSSGVNEYMSINSGGDVKVNTRMFIDGDFDTSSTTFKLKAEFGGSASEAGISINDKDGATNNPHFVQFRRTNTIIGSISRNGSNDSVNYNTSSDYRLKDGIVDKTDGIEKLKQLKPRKFYWKSNTDKTLVDGFLAHEVTDIVPEAISGTKDAVDEDDNIISQAIDQSKLVPLLTAALKESITKIETLEAKVKTLEEG